MDKKQLIVIFDDPDFATPALQRMLQKDGHHVKVISAGRINANKFLLERRISDAGRSLNIGREFLARCKVKSSATPRIVSVQSEQWEFIISEISNRTGYGFIPRFDNDQGGVS